MNAVRDAVTVDSLVIEGLGGDDTIKVDAAHPLQTDIIALELSGGADDDTLIGSLRKIWTALAAAAHELLGEDRAVRAHTVVQRFDWK